MLLLLAAVTLQGTVTDAMRGVDGVVLAADATTGRILAQHRADRAPTRRAAPGSTLKPFTLAALIEEHAASDKVACRGHLTIGERRLDCGHPRTAAPLSGEEAIAYSCNEYFARLAARLDPEKFAGRLREWGFEAAPAVRDDDRALQALGEHGVLVTPAALLNAYRKLARLAGDARFGPIFRGLRGAVEYGSAQLASVDGLQAGGKTGTTPNAGRTATHAWFAGFAPLWKPELVVVVFLEQGRGGPSAAPVAGRVFAEWQGERSSRRGLMPPQARAAGQDSRTLTVGLRGGKTVKLAIEDYVEAVLAGESSGFMPEALKAMAVAARTYAAANRARHAAQGWDFCDTSHCQNLRFDGTSARIRAAVEETEAQLLWHGGAPGQTFYHRHCGGVTEAVHEVWPNLRKPYLVQQQDTFCLISGKAPWRVEVAPRQVEVLGRTPSGRVSRLRVDGRVVPFDAVAAGLRLTSALFDLRDRGDRVVFDGHGAGHGVGMCQTGANERARKGHTWREILAFYYPGTKAGITTQGLDWQRRGGEWVEMWSVQPAQDGAALAAAERALREAESRAGLRVAGRARLRVYPSTAAFRDSTGEPGWVAASTRGSTVRIQPAAVLESRGVLDATLLHEMLHLVVEQRATPSLPNWFREGVVLWLADPDKPATPGSARDGEVDRAASEAAMRSAYERARSRVKRLAERYGRAPVLSWVERGLPAEISAANVSQQPISNR